MRLIILFTAFLLTRNITAQDIYVAYEDESVKIEYTILEVKKKKELVGEIRLIVTNKTTEYIILDFIASLFYEITMAEATQVKQLCVGPGKIKKGKIKGLYYQPETLNYQQLTSDDFEISIDEIKLNKTTNCK
jgi:hypothetical protein